MTSEATTSEGGGAAENLSRDRGSRTAETMAAARASHFLDGHPPLIVEDPFAGQLAGPLWTRLLKSRLRRFLVRKVLLRNIMRTATFGLVRARICDDTALAASGRGVRQLVILGAGLDTFGLRFPESGLTVFEVDLPATAELKRERLAAANLEVPAAVRFVGMDFERDDLRGQLLAGGFEAAQPAVFTFVGVSYYLGAEAVRSTLAAVTRIAAPESELVLDFRRQRSTLSPPDQRYSDRIERFTRLHGEPLVSSFDPEAPADALGLADGWEVVANHAPDALQRRFVDGRKDEARVSPLFHVLHLRRRTDGSGPLPRGG